MASTTTIRCGKTVLLLLLLAALAAGTAAPVAASGGPFAALPPGHWSYRAVERLAALGLISADPTGYGAEDYAVSRYELAVWVLEALRSLDKAVNGATPDAFVVERTWDLDTLLAQYNASPAAASFTSDDIQQLYDLVNLVRNELLTLGQSFTTPQGGVLTTSLSGLAAGMAQAGNGGAVLLDAGPQYMLPSIIRSGGLWDDRAVEINDLFSEAATLALRLPFGDGAGMSANVAALYGQNGAASALAGGGTALGLDIWLPRINVNLKYTIQAAPGATEGSDGQQLLTASAGFGYQLADASQASAGITISGDTSGKGATADFGLRYTVNGASIALGYRISSTSAPEDITLEQLNNVAAAEFTISF